MSVNITYSNLEKSTWTPVIGPSINPVAAVGYAAIPTANGIKYYATGPAWAGVLFKNTCALPPLPSKGQASFSFNLITDDAAAIRSQANEFDVMLSGPSGEVYNLSSQNNNAEGGSWQIVNSLFKWTDTGFKPGVFVPGQVIPVSLSYSFDTVAQTSSVNSISVSGNSFPVPASMQNIPAEKLGWSPNLAILQVQLDLNGQGGAYSQEMNSISFSASW